MSLLLKCSMGNYRGEVSIGFIDDGDWQITCEDEIIFINPAQKQHNLVFYLFQDQVLL